MGLPLKNYLRSSVPWSLKILAINFPRLEIKYLCPGPVSIIRTREAIVDLIILIHRRTTKYYQSRIIDHLSGR